MRDPPAGSRLCVPSTRSARSGQASAVSLAGPTAPLAGVRLRPWPAAVARCVEGCAVSPAAVTSSLRYSFFSFRFPGSPCSFIGALRAGFRGWRDFELWTLDFEPPLFRGIMIRALTVKDILDKQIAKKLA
jgi:hypothetical protein